VTGEKPPKDGPEKIRARKKKSDLLVNADPELIGDPVRIEGSVPILRRPSNHSIRNLSPPVHAGGFFIAPHAEVLLTLPAVPVNDGVPVASLHPVYRSHGLGVSLVEAFA
jgi:hypothetical protein